MKKILIISQALPQDYLNIISDAVKPDAELDLITGSIIEERENIRVFNSPKHNPESIKTRFLCWHQHYKYVCKWAMLHKDCKYDLIFATSNPPINSYIGLKLKKIFCAKFVYMNWDLYPQVIQMSIGNTLAQKICRIWEKWNVKNYPKIDGMITIGSNVAHTIEKSVQDKIKVKVIPIAVDTDYLKPVSKENNTFIKENGLENKFIVLYSGKMGHEHNIDGILAASNILKNYDDIRFVFIGSGEKRSVVEKYISETGCNNVMLFPLQPKEIFPMSVACGDIGIVTVENRSSKLMMPSKAYSIMAAGEAVIGLCSKECDLADLIENKKIGIVVDTNNPQDLADSIYELYCDRTKLEMYKRNARETAVNEYDISIVTEMYREYFKKVLDKKSDDE